MKPARLLRPIVLMFVAMLCATPAIFAQTAAKKPAATASAKTSTAPIDINTATKADLMSISGIGDAYSQKIIDGRPYKRKDELVSKKIVPQATYDKIKDQIIAKQAKK